MKFAEFHAGQVIDAGPSTLHEAGLLAFAQHYDPQWRPARFDLSPLTSPDW